MNYRRYRDAAVEFPDGLIGIVGRNGAGKSSLLESVLWALFGHDAARTGKELLKRQDAAPGEEVLVRLEFEAEGVQYAVTRRLRGKSLQPEASVEAGGQLLVSPGANSWDQANQCVARLLGFDRASFESTVVAKQGELAALSELRPAQRKRLLLDMLGIERIEAAIQACRTEARLLDARLSEGRRALETEAIVRARLLQAQKEAEDARLRLQASESGLVVASERAREEGAKAERLLESRIRDQELRVRLQGLQSRLEALWTQRTRLAAESQILREREAEASRLAQRLASFEVLDREIEEFAASRRASEERGRCERRLAVVEGELARWTPLAEADASDASSHETLVSGLAEVEERLEKGGAELAGLDAERVRTVKEIDTLSRPQEADPWHGLHAEDDCPVCERPLGESLEALARRRKEAARDRARSLEGLGSRLQELEALILSVRERRAQELRQREAIRRELEGARRRLRDAEIARAEIGRLEIERADLKKTIEPLPSAADEAIGRALDARRADRDRLRDQMSRAEEAARRLPRLRDEDRVLHAEETRIVEEREHASRELHQLAYPGGAWEKAKALAEAAQRQVDALERESVQWRERLASWQRESANLAEQAARLDAARQRLDADSDHLKVLETVAAARGDLGILPEFKAHLVGRVRPALSRAAGTLIRQMTGGRYSELVLDEDYGVHLYDGALAHPMERFSGGERDVTNLSLRLAVSELVANARGRSRLQFVALDEVFGSQDGERREAVMRCLAGLSNVFRQVFVVTHLEDVRDRLDHIIRVDEGPDGCGRIEAAA